MDTKLCKTCGLEKIISLDFRKQGTIKNGAPRYHSSCKTCDKIADRKNYRPIRSIREKEGCRVYHTKPKARFTDSIRAAKRRNIPWIILFVDFERLIKMNCYYCNFELGKANSTGSGLDRLNNDQGYELSNVVPCCGICNKIRNNIMNPDELKLVVQTLINYRKSTML